jgi:hypothetical protein
MKSLDTKTMLQCASAGVAVMRVLKVLNATITYQQFARAVGLLRDDEVWEVWHRSQKRTLIGSTATSAFDPKRTLAT